MVPTFNRAHYIEECIDSLLAQTVQPLQIIVIDDGSDDDTAARLTAFGDAIEYVYKDNGGKPAALNHAMPRVRGEFLWIFDDDDVALPDAIEARLNVLDSRPELGFVFSGHYRGSDGSDGRIKRESIYEPSPLTGRQVFFKLLTGCYFTLQSVLARRIVYDSVGSFDQALVAGEDYDMLIRMAERFACAGIPRPTFTFRRHQGLRGPRNLRYSANNRARIFRSFDRELGLKIRRTLPLAAYRAAATELTGSVDFQRAALFARAKIMASKGLIDEMFDDIDQALTLPLPCKKLSSEERGACEEALCTGYAYDAVDENWPAFLDRARRLASLPQGPDVVNCLAKGFLHLAKSFPGTWPQRVRRLYFALTLLARTLPRR